MTHDGRVVVLDVGGHRCGVPIDQVEELHQAVRVTPVPDAAPPVEGVVNVRGDVLPVVDLRARFGLPRRPVDPSDHMAVVRAGGRRIVLRVDQALELVDLPDVDHGVSAVADGVLVIQDMADLVTQVDG